MKRKTTVICLLILMLTTAAYAETTEKARVYPDVRESDWFYKAVMTLSDNGIIRGYPDGTFRPDDTVTYDEMAALAVRCCNGYRDSIAETPGNSEKLSWASAYHSYASANAFYAWEYAMGETESDPDGAAACTREAAAGIISDVLVSDRGEALSLSWLPELESRYAAEENFSWSGTGLYDNDREYRVRYAVPNAIAKGIVEGIGGGVFAGEKLLTRAEAATMIYRLQYGDHMPRSAACTFGEYKARAERKNFKLNTVSGRLDASKAAVKLLIPDVFKYYQSTYFDDGKTLEEHIEFERAYVQRWKRRLDEHPGDAYYEECYAEALSDLKKTEALRDMSSDYHKMMAVYIWLRHTAGTQGDQGAEAYKENYGNEAYAALFMKSAACSGFCRAVKLFADELGIKCEHINADLWTHQWNRALLDGEFYIIETQGGYFEKGDKHVFETEPIGISGGWVRFRRADGSECMTTLESYKNLPQAVIKIH